MRFLSLACSAAILVGCSAATTAPKGRSLPVEPSPRMLAVAFDRSGSQLYYAVEWKGGCVLKTALALSGPVAAAAQPVDRPLDFCPDRIAPLADETLLIASDEKSLWLDAHRSEIHAGAVVVAARDAQRYVTRRGDRLFFMRDGTEQPLPAGVRRVAVLEKALIGVMEAEGGEKLVRIESGGEVKDLSPAFRRIDSFAVAPDQKELVLSAAREEGFDAGLLSTDGGEIHWIGPEPADETNVTWAPRGNKVSYFVRTAGGLLVRTVHVPTSFQLLIDLPLTEGTALAWEPKGERFALILASVDASSRIDVVRYGGENRLTLVPPARRIEVEVTPFPAGGIVVPPKRLRYSERYPAVVWLSAARPFDWSDARGDLRDTEVGMVITPRRLADLDADFWRSLEELAWVDPNRITLVTPERADLALKVPGGVTVLARGEGSGQRAGPGENQWVLIPADSAGTVESFAANWIAERVKGQSTENDRR